MGRDNTLPEQVDGMKQLAARFPWIDIDRAAMWGHSGGGFITQQRLKPLISEYKTLEKKKRERKKPEMETVFIVEVPDSKKPAFPEACVVCRQAQSESLGTLRISDEHGRLDFYFYHLIKRSPNENFLNVPAHDTCIKAVRNNFLKRFFLIMILPVSIGLIGMVYQLSLFYSAITALLVITPFLYWQLTVPVPMEYEHHSGRFILIFKDRNYATDVAHLNHVNVKEASYPDRRGERFVI